MSSFYWKKSSFFGKNGTFIQSNTARAVLEIFYFCFTINENFTDYPFGIRLPDFSKLFTDRKNDNDVTNYRHEFIAKLFVVVVFLWSNLVTGQSFMSILSLVLKLWQFSFIRSWSEIWKSEITPSAFCPISGDWGKLRIPNLPKMSLTKC